MSEAGVPQHKDRIETDAVVIGSGFGGGMIAHALVSAGRNVVMLERGDWVARGPVAWEPRGSLDLTPHCSLETPYEVLAGGHKRWMGAYTCVGGPSVFYGAVSLRYRVDDFTPPDEIVADSGAAWPFDYDTLEPFYARAERLLDVAGDDSADPTAPPRSAPYPQDPAELSPLSQRIAGAARSLGLNPFALPLAINYRADAERQQTCVKCRTCDTFACAINAKNDIATKVLPPLQGESMTLRANTVVTRLEQHGSRVVAVHGRDKLSGQELEVRAERVFLAAGALGTPHLLLASGLDAVNPAGDLIGRYLMRHCNGIAFGFFPRRPDPERTFHKQIGLHDFYFGDEDGDEPRGKLGCIQQLHTPPVALVRSVLPPGVGAVVSPLVEHLTGLLAIAEDQPSYDNRVQIDSSRSDAFGLPQLQITHHYSPRDLAARRALIKRCRRVLRRAGAWGTRLHKIQTFSHALGTVRMGRDERTSVLDAECRFRGLDNLYVVDGSCLPTAAAVNPSLTIAANALRVGQALHPVLPESGKNAP